MEQKGSPMNSLGERLDTFPEAWRPKQAGDKLIGELVDRSTRESEYGDPYEILTVEAEEGSILDGQPIGGEWAWHAFHTMSRGEVRRKNPQIGERVGIAYHGTGEAAPGMNAPERFRLIVERPQQQLRIAEDAHAGEKAEGEAPEDDGIPF
jgi:hypothetical protein